MNKYIAKNPASILSKSIPLSLVISTWDAFDENLMKMGVSPAAAMDGLLQEAKELIRGYSSDTMWVLKPSLGRKGVDVIMISGDSVTALDMVKQAMLDMPDAREWVLQKYVERPLLLRKRKFHLRTYILAVGDLDVYVYTEMFVLLAFGKFEGASYDDISAHLTNTYQNMGYKGFTEDKYVKVLSDMVKCLVKDGMKKETAQQKVVYIYDQIREITAEMFHAFKVINI